MKYAYQLAALLAALVLTKPAQSANPIAWFASTLKDNLHYASKLQNRFYNKYLKGNTTLTTPIGAGKLYGTLGKAKEGYFQRTGYKQVFFDDDRGKLEGEVYHNTLLKLLGLHGVKNTLSGKLKWQKNDAQVTVVAVKPDGDKNIKVSITGGGRFGLLKRNMDVFIEKFDAAFVLRNKS